ncbi:hypothetical protein ADUPG1_013508 [Aduncisulcus paluster]|uniref:Uncharacterized protein n=1 Tax=Aduncisulcus paluster TaxID=2918883 RepID=A0ABQ5K516_9EUKA|nr:hypothetical protein ADUPG1_013508 [Aduncisulcus paluster]
MSVEELQKTYAALIELQAELGDTKRRIFSYEASQSLSKAEELVVQDTSHKEGDGKYKMSKDSKELELMDEIENLRADNEALTLELSQSAATISQHVSSMERLQKSLADAQNLSIEFNSKNESLTVKISENEASIAHLESELTYYKSKNDELTKKLSGDKEDDEEILKRSQDIELYKSNLQKLQRQRSALEQRLHSTEAMSAKAKLDFTSRIASAELATANLRAAAMAKYHALESKFAVYRRASEEERVRTQREHQAALSTLLDRFNEFRSHAEMLVHSEMSRFEDRLSSLLLKFDLELRYVVRYKNQLLNSVIAAKDAKIMRLIDGSDYQALIMRHTLETEQQKRFHARQLDAVKGMIMMKAKVQSKVLEERVSELLTRLENKTKELMARDTEDAKTLFEWRQKEGNLVEERQYWRDKAIDLEREVQELQDDLKICREELEKKKHALVVTMSHTERPRSRAQFTQLRVIAEEQEKRVRVLERQLEEEKKEKKHLSKTLDSFTSTFISYGSSTYKLGTQRGQGTQGTHGASVHNGSARGKGQSVMRPQYGHVGIITQSTNQEKQGDSSSLMPSLRRQDGAEILDDDIQIYERERDTTANFGSGQLTSSSAFPTDTAEKREVSDKISGISQEGVSQEGVSQEGVSQEGGGGIGMSGVYAGARSSMDKTAKTGKPDDSSCDIAGMKGTQLFDMSVSTIEFDQASTVPSESKPKDAGSKLYDGGSSDSRKPAPIQPPFNPAPSFYPHVIHRGKMLPQAPRPPAKGKGRVGSGLRGIQGRRFKVIDAAGYVEED